MNTTLASIKHFSEKFPSFRQMIAIAMKLTPYDNDHYKDKDCYNDWLIDWWDIDEDRGDNNDGDDNNDNDDNGHDDIADKNDENTDNNDNDYNNDNNDINDDSFTFLNKLTKRMMKLSLWENNNIYSTHWGRVTHICVSRLAIIGSYKRLPPDRRQAIIWTNAVKLLIGPLGTNLSEILIEILIFSFKKMHLKMSPGNVGHFVPASMC